MLALHGFLGLPSDWKAIFPFSQKFPVEYLDWMKMKRKAETMEAFAKRFCIERKKQTKKVLVGYSMGGRLALHLMGEDVSLWKAVIFISVAPRCPLDLIEKRRLFEEAWAKRFLCDPWELVLADWNAQNIFKGSKFLEKKETDFSKEQLAQVLIDWSVSRQKDFTDLLKTVRIPILWVVGEKDEKYREIANHLSFSHPKSRIEVLPLAGHRVPWDCPATFSDLCHLFLESL